MFTKKKNLILCDKDMRVNLYKQYILGGNYISVPTFSGDSHFSP